MRILFLVISIIILNGCQSDSGRFDYSRPANLNTTPPAGTPEFQQGWKDGCNGALASVNTDINLLLASRKYKMDGKLWNSSPRYKQAWKDAYYYCAYNMFTNLMNTY
ncbi:MAG: hypothetical protein COV35_01655 [Alphaproteobacteria bacterium CG11_big_fil_rev_8_21_14_0_20_39_49]|nr:MAG: hypothetical protein COV35_01655 [Alphaproteobacteria bacterium CG11_big_fil_rev_8_21_14_0_20_39_49]